MKQQPNPLGPYVWAQNELRSGIVELPGRKTNNPRIVWYHGHTTLRATDDEVPWCSAFMCAAAERAGFPSTRSAAAKSWLDYGEEVKWKEGEEVKIGDIAVFSRTGGNHVAFINAPFRPQDKYINVLGGNQSNSVRVSNYPAKNLLAIRRFPTYS